eukprot:g39788.t1
MVKFGFLLFLIQRTYLGNLPHRQVDGSVVAEMKRFGWRAANYGAVTYCYKVLLLEYCQGLQPFRAHGRREHFGWEMFDDEICEGPIVNTSDLNEELGQVGRFCHLGVEIPVLLKQAVGQDLEGEGELEWG